MQLVTRCARSIQNNGYFGGPLSLSFSSPLFRSLFRYVRLSRTFCTCLFLPRCSLQLLWRTLTLHRLSTPIPASSWNYVEFTLHPRCIITGTCAMHAREHHIHTDLQFTGQRPLNDRPRRINRSPPFLRRLRTFTRKTYATCKVKN